MTVEHASRFQAEFDALKAKYGEAFADFKAVRFVSEDQNASAPREFVPYTCRETTDGQIICEELRQ